jgi:hypothetical protein
MDISEDRVSYLIGQCLRSKAEAEWIFDILVSRNLRKIDLFVGRIDLTPGEHAEFVYRFSAEVEPTIWESSFRKH